MSKLSGIIPAIPTPLLDNEDIDVKGLNNVIDYVIEKGASGVFLFGSMGEGPSLLDSQKIAAVKAAVKHVNKRVPLLVGISDVATRRTLDMGKRMQQLGPDYLVTTAPFYFRFPHPDSILEFLSTLIDNLQTPLVFYHLPGATGNNVDVDTMDKIMNYPQIHAIKDTSCNVHFSVELLRRYPDKETRPCSILNGDEFAYDVNLLMGVDGVVTGGGTVFVDLLVELYKAALEGDKIKTHELQKEFRRKMDDMLGPNLAVDWMHTIKKELKKLGLCDDNVTSPFLKRG